MTKLALFATALLLTACASRPVKTETVTVYVPKMVQVPADLTNPVPYPNADIVTNADLADYALAMKAALEKANRQLEAIREIE